MHRAPIRAAFVLAVVICAVTQVRAQNWDFESAAPGKLPDGWKAAKTGDGEGSVWKIIEDQSAPSGPRVLAQTAKGPQPLFNLCIANEPKVKDLELSAAFKATGGEIDQGGGLVWRYADPSNYYIARFNPLESNFRLYKVVDGKRVQLATKEKITAPAGEWHTLSVRMKADEIACSLNGKRELEAKDGTFDKAGLVGLWTKADAQTYFDKVQVDVIK